LLAPASYLQATDAAKAGDQTGLASGSLLTQARQEIALGVYGTDVPTLLRVALQGPCGAFPAVDDWRVDPWKAPCLWACVELATLKRRSSRFCGSSSVGEGSCLNSKCPGPISPAEPKN
jgi:hypothetical protein